MRSKHAVWLFALVLIACALPGAALASTARVQGMNLQGDYLLDYVNVQNYPSAIVRYQNLVYGDLGVKDPSSDANDDVSDFLDNNNNPELFDAGRSMGVILGNIYGGRIGTFGIFLNENATPLSSALGADRFNRNGNEAWDVIWGYKFSKFALGLEFNRSFSSVQDTTERVKPFTSGPYITGFSDFNGRQFFNLFTELLGADHWNTLGVGGGITFDWDRNGLPNFADFSFEARQYRFEDVLLTPPPVTTAAEDNASMSFAFNGRSHIALSDVFHLVPVVNYYHLDLGTKIGATSYDNTVNGIQAGLAGQWKLRDSDWLVVGASFQNVTIDFANFNNRDNDFDGGPGKVEYLAVPNIFGALESNLWPWFTLRLGASKPAYSRLRLTGAASSFIGAAGEFEMKDSPILYSVGTGFHLGRVDLDAVLNQDFPFTGSYLASGNSEIPFTSISATYRW